MATPTATPTTPLIPRTRRVTLNSPVSSGNTALGVLKSIYESLRKIETLVKSNASLQRQQTEQQRRQGITRTRQQQEKQAETPKLINPLKYLQGALPKTGFLDAIRNFILYTFMGFAFTKLVKFLPKILSTLKFIDPFIKFTENFVGSVFKNFVDAIDLGYEQYDKVRALAKQVGGEKFEKQFDELSSTLNKFLNTAIIVGLAIAGSGTIGGGGKKLPTRISPRPGVGGQRFGASPTRLSQYFNQTRAQEAITKKYGFDAARLYQDKINRGSTPAQALDAVKQRFSQRAIPTGGLAGKGRTAGNIGARGLGNVQQRASLKLLGKGGAKILGKVPIIGPIADFLISTLIFKERPDRAAAGAVGAAVGAALGSFPALIPFGGPIWGGLLGDIVGRSLFDVTTSMQGQGEKVQKKAAGGAITRGGRPIRRTLSRTTPKRTKRLQRSKQQLPQPGQNIGGLKQIKKVFASPKKPGKKNPLRALKNISEIMNKNRDPLFGGIMVATSNLPLGQKPDPSLGLEIKNNFATLIDNAIAAQSSKEVNQIQRSIVAAAEGGVIPASRTLRTGPSIGEQLGAAISRSFQNALNSRTNEIFQSLRREMGLKGEEPLMGTTPGGGPEDGPDVFHGMGPERMWNFFKNKGLSDFAVAGILGNADVESDFIPTIKSPNGKFIGLFQWDKDIRWPALVNWATKKDLDPWAFDTQLMYAWHELQTSESHALAPLRAATSASEAAEVWRAKFERGPGDPEGRKRDAEKWYKKYKGIMYIPPTTIIKGGKIKGGAIVTQRGDPDAEQTGSDISLGNHKVGAQIQNPFQSLKITKVGFQGSGSGETGTGYGRYITGEAVINGKKYELLLGHLDKSYVKRGDILEAGDIIGTQGISGHATGPHVTTHVNALDGGDPNKILTAVENVWMNGGSIKTDSMGPQPKQQPPKQPPGRKTATIGGMPWTQSSDGSWTNLVGNRITNAEFNQKLLEEKNKNKPKDDKKPWWDIFGTQSNIKTPTQSQPIAKAQFAPMPLSRPDIAKDSAASNPDVITNTLILAMTPTA